MTPLTSEQVDQLENPLERSRICQRLQGGKQLTYIVGWDAIDKANEIFGYSGWSLETEQLTQIEACSREDENNKGFRASFWAIVKITIYNSDREIECVRSDVGYGSGFGPRVGDAVESATKEAATDATKRALRTFGNQFGLALYDGEKKGVEQTGPTKVPDKKIPEAQPEKEATGNKAASAALKEEDIELGKDELDFYVINLVDRFKEYPSARYSNEFFLEAKEERGRIGDKKYNAVLAEEGLVNPNRSDVENKPNLMTRLINKLRLVEA